MGVSEKDAGCGTLPSSSSLVRKLAMSLRVKPFLGSAHDPGGSEGATSPGKCTVIVPMWTSNSFTALKKALEQSLAIDLSMSAELNEPWPGPALNVRP